MLQRFLAWLKERIGPVQKQPLPTVKLVCFKEVPNDYPNDVYGVPFQNEKGEMVEAVELHKQRELFASVNQGRHFIRKKDIKAMREFALTQGIRIQVEWKVHEEDITYIQ